MFHHLVMAVAVTGIENAGDADCNTSEGEQQPDVADQETGYTENAAEHQQRNAIQNIYISNLFSKRYLF